MERSTKDPETYLGTIQVHTHIKEKTRNKIENFSDVTARYQHLENEPKEHLYAVFLTNANEEIGDKLLGLGGTASVNFDILDLVRTAAIVNAGAAILVHNHPSGDPEPAKKDKETTHEAFELLDKLGVELLDHVIISRNGSSSMRARVPDVFDVGGGE